MKIKETRDKFGEGLGGGFWLETRVRKLAKDEEMPEGAVEVPAETPDHDWQKESK